MRAAISMLLPVLMTVLAVNCGTLSAQGPQFVRGDVSGDGTLRLDDATRMLSALFRGAGFTHLVPCDDAADADDDGRVTISDAVLVLQFLFLGGRAPLPPYPACGEDVREDDLADCSPPSHCLEPLGTCDEARSADQVFFLFASSASSVDRGELQRMYQVAERMLSELPSRSDFGMVASIGGEIRSFPVDRATVRLDDQNRIDALRFLLALPRHSGHCSVAAADRVWRKLIAAPRGVRYVVGIEQELICEEVPQQIALEEFIELVGVRRRGVCN